MTIPEGFRLDPHARCGLCGLTRGAPRHRRMDMQSYHAFEEPAGALVPVAPVVEAPPRMFPVHPDRPHPSSPASVPWEFIAPHEAQARRNHDQTLERLAERGGLGECEMVAVLENRRWTRMDDAVAAARLNELLAAWKEFHPDAEVLRLRAALAAAEQRADRAEDRLRRIGAEIEGCCCCIEGYVNDCSACRASSILREGT